MNKKVMALAVAGALAAPVSALAQTTIYGQFEVEYGFYSPGNNPAGAAQHSSDFFNSGASRIGFRGEEKLGGGMSAWYQCESDVRFLDEGTQQAGSLCDRNSAVGLKGEFGNLFFGNWDSPLKTATGTTRVTNEGGWLGTQGILLSDFSNRNRQTINYQSPALGGFTVGAQVSNTRAAADQPETNQNVDGRVMALGAQFATGALVVAAGYETREKNFATLVGSGQDAEDTAMAIGATYRFGGFLVGLTFVNIEADDGTPGGSVERDSFGLAGQYRTGPHLFTVGYTVADDFKCTGCPTDTGATQIVVSYNYFLSKRTSVGVGYSQVKNDDNTGAYNLDNRAAMANGESSDVISFSLKHVF